MMNTWPNDFSSIQSQQSYTDIHQLNDIRQEGKKDQDAALRKIAQQFESMFMHMMLKSMRQANDVFAKDNPLNSFEVNFHKDMLDHQMSLSLSESGKFGLADALYRQLSGRYADPSVNSTDENNDLNVPQRTIPTYDHDFYQRRAKDEEQLDAVDSPEAFIEMMTPYAKEVAEKMGVDYRILIAQSALETGWGSHVIKDRYGKQSFNLFNIKADKRWQGHHVNVSTLEYRDGVAQKESANFRRYDSIAESFNDYQKFLSQSRYKPALAVAEDGHAFVAALQQAGYATDPRYAEKITSIVDTYFN